MVFRTLAACAVLAVTSLAHAQSHRDSFVYQGTLQDESAPANGLYDISFVVFDVADGGTPIADGFVIAPGVLVSDGLFEAFIDFGVSGAIFDSDSTRWLELRVRPAGGGAFDVLSPRQRLAPAPLANYALRSGTSLQDAYDNGPVIVRGSGDGPVEIRSSTSNPAQLNLGSSIGTETYGQLTMYGPTGNRMITAERDGSFGGGGYFSIKRNDDGDNGFILEGNANNSESAQLTMFGQRNGILLSTDLTSDDSVQVPNNAINSLETINEVGVSEIVDTSGTVLTESLATIDLLNSVTISAPLDGYVLVLASAEVTVSHISGTSSSINIGVSDSPSNFNSNTDLELSISTNAPNGIYEYPITSHAIFPASQGINTYYFLADKDYLEGGVQILDRQLSAIYIPTSYGTIERDGAINQPDELNPFTAPKTNYDIVMEQNTVIMANNERLEREIEAMKAQMRTLLEASRQEADRQTRD